MEYSVHNFLLWADYYSAPKNSMCGSLAGKDGNGQIWTFDEYDDAERVATRVSNYTGKGYKIASVISFEEEYDRIFRGEYPTLICDNETVYPVAIV